MQTGESNDLMSVLGHDLRSPLTAIRGAATLLLQAQGGLEPAKVAELLRLIDSQAARMADRVEDVLVAGRLDRGAVRVEIRDRGPGVAPEQRERIFGRGVKLAEEGPGAGLGLYVVRGLVEAMSGQAGVEPRPGGGSSFWVTLKAK